MTNISTIINRLRHECNTKNLSYLKSFLNNEIRNQKNAIKRLFYVDNEVTNRINSELTALLSEINKCNTIDTLRQLVENKIIKTLQKNMTTTPQEKQIEIPDDWDRSVVERNEKQGIIKSPENNQEKDSNFEIEQKKKELIEKLKKQHTSIKINHRNEYGIRGKRIHINLGNGQFDFFIPQKKVKINDYLNNIEYTHWRTQSASPKILCKLLNAIREYMKEGGVDIDKDYHNQDINYSDHIKHSDSEAGKIAAEIMKLNGSYFVNIEKDTEKVSPRIPFKERIPLSEAYALISYPGRFVLKKFKVNEQYKDAERNVLMEGN